MKKYLFCILLIISSTVFIKYTFAVQIKNKVLANASPNVPVRLDIDRTYDIVFTRMVPRSISVSNIKVENTVQRKKLLGSWTNVGNKIFYVSSVDQKYEEDYNMVYHNEHRSLWLNETSGSTLTADFTFDDGPASLSPIY